jgi:hypothetical protein
MMATMTAIHLSFDPALPDGAFVFIRNTLPPASGIIFFHDPASMGACRKQLLKLLVCVPWDPSLIDPALSSFPQGLYLDEDIVDS